MALVLYYLLLLYGIPVLLILASFIMMWLAWRFSPFAKSPQRPHWKLIILIVVVLMLTGSALSLIWPLWLAPPNFQYTSTVYLVFLFLWVPVLLIGVLLRPAGSTLRSAFTMLILGYFVCILALAFSKSGSGSDIESKDCQQTNLPESQVEYICKHAHTGISPGTMNEQYILDGTQNSPFAQLISVTNSSPP